jgi:ferredoxin
MDVFIRIDASTCIGYGECVGLDPDAVELDEDGIAHPLDGAIDRERADALVQICPTGAISIVE